VKVAMKLVGINETCALSGGNSSNALGSRAKFHRRTRDHSARCASEAANSLPDMGLLPRAYSTSRARHWRS
jgi:hypothetical protein